MINERIFRAYDIRGQVGPDLNKEIAYHIGKAFASMNLQDCNKVVCVGYDGRVSSLEIFTALTLGLADYEAEVINIGLVPSPMLYFADYMLKPAASIMITGSHNPKNDNGFKMLSSGKSLHGEQIQYLKSLVLRSLQENLSTEAKRAPAFKSIDVHKDYIKKILEDIVISPTLKVVWDNGNGAAGKVLESLLSMLPNQNILLNKEIDGNFPSHHPDPTVAENLTELINTVKANEFDLGIAFDGDGDRIGVVDSRGNIIWGDQLLTIFAEDILKSSPGAAIVMDIKASNALLAYIRSLGGQPAISKVGHGFIKEKMKETGAVIAGELSGHMFFADKYFGYDDAIYAALRLIDLLSRNNQSLDVLFDALPKTYNTPEIRVTVPEEQKFAIIEHIKASLQTVSDVKINDIDGIRVEMSDGWWLLRASNTEAKLNIRCEANSRARLEGIKADVNKLIAPFNISI
jgi:phosphomannomutase